MTHLPLMSKLWHNSREESSSITEYSKGPEKPSQQTELEVRNGSYTQNTDIRCPLLILTLNLSRNGVPLYLRFDPKKGT